MKKRESNILLDITKDGLYAYITLLNNDDETEEAQFDYSLILKEIKETVKYGLKEELLESFLEHKFFNEQVCIAEGVAPIPGEDGYLKYYFDTNKQLLPKLNEDGTVDYRELDAINSVKKGDKLVEIIPPEEGKDGVRVTGEKIQHLKGKEPRLKFGNNVKLSEDGSFLLAEESGLVEIKDGRIRVSKVLEISNVDTSIGNVYFDGNVIIKGHVLNGFQVKAHGSIEVRGVVEGGYINCTGDILVRQGVQGYNRQTIFTEGNLATKFIENSIIQVNKNITSEAIMHSQVTSKGNILVLGKKGLIVGGVCRAQREIRARIVGSTMATNTVLEVGVDPDIKSRHEELGEELKNVKENLEKITQSLSMLEVLKRSNKLDSNKNELYSKLTKTQLTLSLELRKIERLYKEVAEQIENLSKGQIKIADTIYPGVKIVIGNSVMYIRDEMKRCTFYKENRDIRVGPY